MEEKGGPNVRWIEGDVARRGQGTLVLRVTEENVEELVAEHSLDVIVAKAVFLDEGQIDEEPGPLLARHRHGRNAFGELDRGDLQDRANSEWVLIDEFAQNHAEALRVHA